MVNFETMIYTDMHHFEVAFFLVLRDTLNDLRFALKANYTNGLFDIAQSIYLSMGPALRLSTLHISRFPCPLLKSWGGAKKM